MFIDKNRKRTSMPVEVDKNGKSVSLPIDQLPAQSFNVGQTGFPESGLTVLVRANNVQELERLLQNSAILAQRNENAGKSIREILDGIWPKNMQTPSEIAYVSERAAQLQLDFEKNRTSTLDVKSEKVDSSSPSSDGSVDVAESK